MGKVPAGHPERPQGEEGRRLLMRMNGGGHEELANWALDWLGPEELAAGGHRARMLDVGCGGGANLRRLLERVPGSHATGVDYSPVSVSLSREVNAASVAEGRCEVVEGDVGDLPFSAARFDLACAFETIYFWPDPIRALKEVARVLVPGGRLLVANDDDGTRQEAQDIARQIEGMRVYTADDLVALMREAGFSHVEVAHDPASGRLAVVGTRPAA